MFGQVLSHWNLSITNLILHLTFSNYQLNFPLDSQVLFEGPNKVMGHAIQKWSSMKSGTSTQLFRCLQEMSAAGSSNTCHTAGWWGSEILYKNIIKDCVSLLRSLFVFPFLPTDGIITSLSSPKKNRKLDLNFGSVRQICTSFYFSHSFHLGLFLNCCFVSEGTAKLRQGDELELVIPDRPNAIINMDVESTFFGVIQMKWNKAWYLAACCCRMYKSVRELYERMLIRDWVTQAGKQQGPVRHLRKMLNLRGNLSFSFSGTVFF